MATNNATNTSKPVTVPQGGTGLTSTTAYAVLCGGTTSTSALQSIASVGTSGQLLRSNGAGALPTFQTTSGVGTGYVLSMQGSSGVASDPADAITYFMGFGLFTAKTASGEATTRIYVPHAGTISKMYGSVTVQGTLGSNQNCTVAIRLNNTTDTNVTTTLQLTAASNTFNNTGLSIAVAAGDYIEIKFISPTWGTNPTTVFFSASLYIS